MGVPLVSAWLWLGEKLRAVEGASARDNHFNLFDNKVSGSATIAGESASDMGNQPTPNNQRSA